MLPTPEARCCHECQNLAMSKKNHISLIRYYNLGATLPFSLALVIGLFLSASHKPDPNYVSEYFRDDGFGQTVFLYILLSMVTCLLSSALFLNSYKIISDHFAFSILVWMFLPFSLLAYSFYRFTESSSTFSSKYEGNSTLDFFFVFIVLSHLVMLIISFYQFRSVLARIAALHK